MIMMLMKYFSFRKMISIESYRIIIGKWAACQKSKKQKEQRKRHFTSMRGKVCLLWGLTLMMHIILSMRIAVPSSTEGYWTRERFGRVNESHNVVFKRAMPATLVSKLLERGGVEINPGPARDAAAASDDRPFYLCGICNSKFTRRSNMLNHRRNRHMNNMNIKCRVCGKELLDMEEWEKHMVEEHKPRTTRWKMINSAFQGKIFELAYMFDSNDSIEESLGPPMMLSVQNQVKFYRRYFGQIKYSITYGAMMRRETPDDTMYETFYFRSEDKSAVRGEYGIDDEIRDTLETLRRRVLDLEISAEGSGWSFETAEVMTLRIVKLGSKKMGKHIPFMPRNKQGNKLKIHVRNTINVKNNDDRCVLYNIVLSLFGKIITGNKENPKNLERFLRFIDCDGVCFPVEEHDLRQLELNNKESLNIAINVWRFLAIDHIEPFFLSKNISKNHRDCDMLMIEGKSSQGQAQTTHLVHIKNRAALFRPAYATGQQPRLHPFFCPSCKLFRSESMEKTAQHFKRCSDNDYVEKVLPPAVDDFVPNGRMIPQPSSYRNSAPILRGFMDFETLHKKLPDDFCQPCHSILKNLNTNSKIEIFCKHKQKKQTFQLTQLPAVCFSLLIVDQNNKKVWERYYEGEDAGREFTKLLIREESSFYKYIDSHARMMMSTEDVQEFEAASVCPCGKVFGRDVVKCRDHDHYTGDIL